MVNFQRTQSQQHRGVAWWCGWGGFVLVVVIGAAAGASDNGLTGALGDMLTMAGLYTLAVAVIALGRGHVSWPLLRNRGRAVLGTVAALVLLGVGGTVNSTPADAGSRPGSVTTNTSAAVASSVAATSTSSSQPSTAKVSSSRTSHSPTPQSMNTATTTHHAAGAALLAAKNLP